MSQIERGPRSFGRFQKVSVRPCPSQKIANGNVVPELAWVLRSTGRTIYRNQDFRHSKTARRRAV
jgi:hypothetical protein